MSRDKDYAYFILSFSLILKKSFLVGALIVIEYLIHAIDFTESLYFLSTDKSGILSKINIMKNHRSSLEHQYYQIILLVLFGFLNVFYYLYMNINKLKSSIAFNYIFVNFYELFHFRFISIFIYESYVMWFARFFKDFNFSSEFFLTFFWLFWLGFYLYTQISHINVNYIFIQTSKMSYPFDINSKTFEIFFCFQKIISVILHYTLNSYAFYFLCSLYFFILLLEILYYIYIYTVTPLLLLTNFHLHLIKFCLYLFQLLNFVLFFVNIKEKNDFYYISVVFSFIFCTTLGFLIKIDIFKVISDKPFDPFSNLLYILGINGDLQESTNYLNVLNIHKKNCNNSCEFCKKMEKKYFDQKTATTETTKSTIRQQEVDVSNQLYYYYSVFLSLLMDERNQKNIEKSSKNLTKTDKSKYISIMKSLKEIFNQKKSPTFTFLISLANEIQKYERTNETLSLNLQAIHLVFYEKKDSKEKIILNDLKAYIKISRKLRRLIKEISKNFNKSKHVTLEKFLKIGKDIHKLRTKNLVKYLNSKEIHDFYITEIMTFLVEEITNVPINKDKGMLKENFSFNEEFLSTNFNQNRQILIDLNQNLKRAKIKKSGKDLVQYVGTNLFNLFHKNFYDVGVKMFFESLESKTQGNTKSFQFILDYEKENIPEKKESFNRLEEIKNKVKKVKFFEMNYRLICENLESKHFFIIGEYSFDQEEIVITKSPSKLKMNFDLYNESSVKKVKKNYEKIYAINLNKFSSTKLISRESRRNIIQFGEKAFPREHNVLDISLVNLFGNNKKRLIQLFSIEKDNSIYNIYKCQIPHKKAIKRENELASFESSKSTDSDKSTFDYLRYNESSSIAGSAKSQSSVFSIYLKKKNIFNEDYDKQSTLYQWYFNLIIRITVITYFVIILESIISLILEFGMNSEVLSSYAVYTNMRAVNRLFYNIMTSILAMVCVGHPNSSQCRNFFFEYTEKIKKENNFLFSNFEFTYFENHYKIEDFGLRLSVLKSSLYEVNDDRVTELFNAPFNYAYLSINNDSIIIYEKNITFVNAVETMINSWTKIVNSDDYFKSPVYIFTMTTRDFSYVPDKNNMKTWQKEYYNTIMNYEKYIENWESIQQALHNVVSKNVEKLNRIMLIFLSLILLCHCLLFILIFYFLFSFDKILSITIEKIFQKINNTLYFNYFKNKYIELETLSKFYQRNPLSIFQSIEHLNEGIRKEINEERKSSGDSTSHLINEEKTPEPEKGKRMFRDNEYKQVTKYFYIILYICIAFCSILFLIYFSLWIDTKNKMMIVFDIITKNTMAANIGYNSLALEQIMILGNKTEPEVSKDMNYDGEYYVNDKTHESLITSISLEVPRRKVGNLMRITNEYIDLDCNTFFSEVKDDKFNQVEENHKEFQFKDHFPKICDSFHILEHKEDNFIYLVVFYQVQTFTELVWKMYNRTYDALYGILEQDYLYYQANIQFLIFRPFRTWFNRVIYQDAIDRTIVLEKLVLYAIFILILASEFILFFVLILFFFIKLKRINNILVELKNVFKVLKK